ncbi:MAG TPA: hypothetical protein DC047_10465 [Blastocatellia bacterium]|nr:hypothetical protein [Blastocatellia bacterium]
MKRVRVILGLIAGAIFLASGAAHSFLGWKQLTAAFAPTQVPSDLILGLAVKATLPSSTEQVIMQTGRLACFMTHLTTVAARCG